MLENELSRFKLQPQQQLSFQQVHFMIQQESARILAEKEPIIRAEYSQKYESIIAELLEKERKSHNLISFLKVEIEKKDNIIRRFDD